MLAFYSVELHLFCSDHAMTVLIWGSVSEQSMKKGNSSIKEEYVRFGEKNRKPTLELKVFKRSQAFEAK